MITVEDLILKLSQCPKDLKVLFADKVGPQEARSLSADVYGEAFVTPAGGGEQEQVVILTCDDPNPVVAERDRWLNRVLKLEHRLEAVRSALTLEKDK